MQTWTLLAPPPDLADTVECLYVTEPSSTGRYEVMPDGRVDVAWVEAASGPRFEVFGPATHAQIVAVEPRTRYFGLRIRPGLAGCVLREEVWRLADCRLKLQTLHGIRASEVTASSAARSAFALLENVVRRAIRPPSASSRWARRAVDAITPCAGIVRVEELARDVGMSRRALERVFASEIGDSPKHFLRISRLRTLGQHLRRAPANVRWALLAAGLGYADQSHLVRDVRQLTGYRPTQFWRRVNEMPADWV